MNVPIVLSNLIEFENRTRLFIWIHNYLIYILFFLFDYFIIKHLTQKKRSSNETNVDILKIKLH